MFPTRYIVDRMPMYDSNAGPHFGVVCTYSGEAKKHPWTATRPNEYVMDGRGCAYFTNSDVYEGEFRFGAFSGHGKLVYGDPAKGFYEGGFENNLAHGLGVLDTPESVYIGAFRDGEKHGAGEETIAATGEFVVGLWRCGKREGPSRSRLPDGTIVDGVCVDGHLQGLVTVTYPNGDEFVCPFVDGKPHGVGRYTQIDSGDCYAETFERGVMVTGVLEDDEDPVGGLMKKQKPQQKPEDRPADVAPLAAKNVEDDEDDFAAQLQRKVAAERAERERLAAARPPRVPTCTVTYKATGDTYSGGWRRDAVGSANRRGVRHGHGEQRIAASGDRYVGGFADDMREGFGELVFGSQASAAAVLTPAMLQTTSATTRAALRIVGDFHLDVPDGKCTVYFDDGSVVEQFFSKGRPHGIAHDHCPPFVPPPLAHEASPSEVERSSDAAQQRQGRTARFPGDYASVMFDAGREVELDYHRRAAQPEET